MDAWLETEGGEQIPIHGHFTMGRGSNNALVLPGERVSRLHALIHKQDKGEHWLVDFSTNGVRVNGRRVKQSIQLKDHDQMEVGATILTFRQGHAESLADKPGPQQTTNYMTVTEVREHVLWLLDADIEGSTALSTALPGDQLAKLMSRWFKSCKEIIENNGGSINKYLGDGFLAYWPSPAAGPEVIATVLGELKKLRADQSFTFRLVVHHGSITMDNAVAEGEDSLLGQEVIFIFRMEKLAAGLKQRCFLSNNAAELLRPYGVVTSCGEHTLAGFTGKYEFFGYEPKA